MENRMEDVTESGAIDRAEAAISAAKRAFGEPETITDFIATLSSAPAVVADRSDRIDQLAMALSKVQGALTAAERNAWNPHFESHYSDIADIVGVARQPMADNDLAWWQDFEQDRLNPEWITCVTTIAHGPSGQWKVSRCSTCVTPKVKRGQSPPAGWTPGPHDIAAGQTFARRIGFASALGVVAAGEDDDGNEAGGKSGEMSERQETTDAFLADKPELAAAFKVEHPIIRDIYAKLGRYGSISEKQIKFVMDLAAEHGGPNDLRGRALHTE
jgi:hypothetical protein